MESGRFAVIPARAAFDPLLDPAPFRLLAVLGTYGNTAGFCYPTQGTLAARAGVSRQAICKHLGVLESRGYLRIIRDEEEKREVLRRYCNRQESVSGCVYRIIHDVLPDQADPEEADAPRAVNSADAPRASTNGNGLFDSAAGVQPEVAPHPNSPGGCNLKLQGVQPEVAGGATPEVAGGATSEVYTMNVPMNVPKNDGERPAAAVGFWNENLTSAETVAVAKLIALGFERLDAIAQTRRRGPDQVEIAIANSESIEASGDLLSRRGYIVKCIREGWPPRENDPVAKARKKAAERAEQQRLRDQSIAARRNESERLKHEIDAGLIELWAFIDGLPPGRFESISTQVLRAKPHVAPKDGRDPRRHSPLCRQVKAWLEGSFIAAPVVPRSDLRVPQSVEAASC